MVDPIFVTCSSKSFRKVWCPFLLNQLPISWISNPLGLHINVATLPVNETFVCNRAEGYMCVRKDRRGRPVMFLASENKSYKRVTGHTLWWPFVNLWVGRQMWIYWNGIMKRHCHVDHIITMYHEAGKETASLLKGIIHISLSLFKVGWCVRGLNLSMPLSAIHKNYLHMRPGQRWTSFLPQRHQGELQGSRSDHLFIKMCWFH